MKKKPLILLIVGVVCLIIGGYLYSRSNNNSVNDRNLEIAKNATSAEDAARQISANNRGEVDGNELAMGLLGFGAVLTLGGIFGMAKRGVPVA